MISLTELVRFRARTEMALRNFFLQRDVVEVATPTLVPSPGMEPHLSAFPVLAREAEEVNGHFLHTSPEYAIKSVFGALDCDVWAMARCYRDEPPSPLHHPEFTMVEWYRREADYRTLMTDCEQLVEALQHALGLSDDLQLRDGSRFSLATPWDRLSVQDAFREHAGLELPEHDDDFRRAARAAGLDVPDDWDWDACFTLVYTERIEPALARDRPVFLHSFPARQAALSRLCPDDPTVAERFELYFRGTARDGSTAGGIELANAFSELIDPRIQRARFAEERDWRERTGRTVYPMPEAMLRGLARMPPTAGIALGFERLLVCLAEYALHERFTVADFLLGEPLGRTVGPL